MFRVQTTINGKSWRNLSRAPFSTQDAAWNYARSLDQDGFIMPDVRVVDENGKAVERPAN